MKELSTQDGKGYILYRKNNEMSTEDESRPATGLGLKHTNKILQEFQPHLLQQHQGRLTLTYDNFADAVDDFFAHIGGQKRAIRADAAEAAAKDKLEKIRHDQERRVESLVQEQEKLKRHAQLVEVHADDVDKALSVINSALDSGMDWEALEQLVETEQSNQNPIAMLIKRLDLSKDAMILSLIDTRSDMDNRTVDITVLLHESAHGNASNMFAKYRASKDKSQKTIEASTKALKAAEATAQRQLAEAQKKSKLTAAIHQKRKPHWFEKFNWMITGDNFLVLGGRDAQQNETLVKRYLRPGDAYLHADVHGAASCILRAKRRRTMDGKTAPLALPEQALREAGNFTICRSSAWASRMVTSAWWVESHQVSKTAPSGEYLTVGSFMVRGKKNFLPPSQLEMGLAILFRLGDDESIARHLNDRRDFSLLVTDEGDVDEMGRIPTEVNRFATESEEEQSQCIDEPHRDESDDVGPVKEEEGPDDTSEPFKDSEESHRRALTNEPVIDSASHSQTESDSPESLVGPRQKKGLSKKDRKLIKKYGSLEAAEVAISERQELERSMEKSQLDERDMMGKQPSQTGAKRGKRSKLKRAAKKYGDQDEEERELALLALHAGEHKSRQKNGKLKEFERSVTEMKAAEETAALLTKDAQLVANGLPQPVRDALADCITLNTPEGGEVIVSWEKFDADVLEQLMGLPEEQQLAAAKRLLFLKLTARVDNFSASLSGIVRTIHKYGHENLETEESIDDRKGDFKRKTKSERRLEEEAWKVALAEEGIIEDDLDGDAIDDTFETNKLTGKPLLDDSILYAVPVCAPYQTLSQYMYRVKLTPGNQKRGKAAKQCVDLFLTSDGNKSVEADRHKELIKQIGDNDFVQVMCSDVKISAAGASKAAKKSKTSRKKSGKKKKT